MSGQPPDRVQPAPTAVGRRPIREGWLSAVVVGAVLTATAGRLPAQSAVSRDSAGTAVVTSTAAARPAVVTLPPTPVLELGGDPGVVEFGAVVAAFRQTSGHLVVADRSASRIHRFDARGRLVATVGRKGAGPGEYQRITAAYPGPGDSIFVFDAGTRRLTVLGPDGTTGRSGTIDLAEGRTASAVFGVFADGRLLASAGVGMDASMTSGVRRDPVAIAVTIPGGGSAQVGRFPSTENLLQVKTSGQTIQSVNIIRIPFGRSTVFGRLDTLVVVAEGDRFEIGLYSPAGRPVRRIVRPTRPVPVTPADRERFFAEQTANLADPAARAQLRERLEAAPMPATMPAYDLVVPAANGDLWVREYLGPWARQRPGRWIVFDPQGVWRTTVETPAGLVPAWIDDANLVGTWLDEDDIPRVRVHRLPGR